MRLKTRIVKLIIAEVTSWAAFSIPLFVSGVELGKQLGDSYWLVVSVTIGYVAATTLLLWLPVKLVFNWLKLVTWMEGKWSPSMMLYFLLTSLPCCVIFIVGIETARNGNKDFQNSCVELLVIMMLVTDWADKIKKYELRKPEVRHNINEMTEYPPSSRGSVSSQSTFITRLDGSGTWVDIRPGDLFNDLLNFYDVRLLLATASGQVLHTGWIYPIHVIGLIASSTFVLTHASPYRTPATMILLEIPFFLLRLSLLCKFGQITSILFLLKNLFVVLALIYFNLVVPKLFKFYQSRNFTSRRVNTVNYDVTNKFNVTGADEYKNYNLSDLPRTLDDAQSYDDDVTSDVTKGRRHRGTLSEDLYASPGESPKPEEAGISPRRERPPTHSPPTNQHSNHTSDIASQIAQEAIRMQEMNAANRIADAAEFSDEDSLSMDSDPGTMDSNPGTMDSNPGTMDSNPGTMDLSLDARL